MINQGLTQARYNWKISAICRNFFAKKL